MRIGLIGASLWAATGYGRVLRELATRLVRTGYEVVSIGQESDVIVWGARKEFPLPDGRSITTLVMTNPLLDEEGTAEMVRMYVRRHGIDVLLSLWDAFAVGWMGRVGVPWLAYVPVDGYDMDHKWASYLNDAFYIIAMSKFGYAQLLRWFSPWRLALIPHGVDTGVFRPIEDVPKELLRLQLKTAPPVPQNCFLALCVAANYGPRKQLPLLLYAWKKFVVDMGHEDAHLLLWTNPVARLGQGYDLPQFIRHFGLEGHVHFPEVNPILEPLPDQGMRVLYCAADVTVLLSSAEGFGLPCCESQACGTPVIATNCSALTELVRGHGWLVDVVDPEDYASTPSTCPTPAPGTQRRA